MDAVRCRNVGVPVTGCRVLDELGTTAGGAESRGEKGTLGGVRAIDRFVGIGGGETWRAGAKGRGPEEDADELGAPIRCIGTGAREAGGALDEREGSGARGRGAKDDGFEPEATVRCMDTRGRYDMFKSCGVDTGARSPVDKDGPGCLSTMRERRGSVSIDIRAPEDDASEGVGAQVRYDEYEPFKVGSWPGGTKAERCFKSTLLCSNVNSA